MAIFRIGCMLLAMTLMPGAIPAAHAQQRAGDDASHPHPPPPPPRGAPPPYGMPPPRGAMGRPPPPFPPPPRPPREEEAPAMLPVPAPIPAVPAASDTNAASDTVHAAPSSPIAESSTPAVASPIVQVAPSVVAVSPQSEQASPDGTLAADPPQAGQRSWIWLSLPLLGAALLAWWASLRRAQQLQLQAEHLTRQQRFLKSAHSHLQRKSEKLQYLSMHDPLTGTLNRQAFAAELRERIEHLAKYNQPLCLIVFDLDHFKQINDRHGHLAGDAALALVVGVAREHLVSDDLFGRFGGDEFMIACGGQNAAQAVALAEALRTAVASRAPRAELPIPDLTLSLGVAQADPQRGYDADELFARADASLYAAKRRGRNRVVVDACGEPLPTPDMVRRHL